MVISWSADRYKKLFAALLAAHPEIKPNYKQVAVYFGEGATYDSIECRMRDIKAHARKLRAEVESGARPNEPARPTPKGKKRKTSVRHSDDEDDEELDEEELRTPSRPKKARGATKSSTITSRTPRTPVVARAMPAVSVREPVESTSDFELNDEEGNDDTAYPSPQSSPTKSSTHAAQPMMRFPTRLVTPERQIPQTTPQISKQLPPQTPTKAKVVMPVRQMAPEIIDLADSDEESNEMVAITPNKAVQRMDEVVIKPEALAHSADAEYESDY